MPLISDNNIAVAALTVGKNLPSARFRVRQYINLLRQEFISVKEHRSIIEKSKVVPVLGGKLRTRYFLPIHMALEATKVLCDIPRVSNANFSDLIWLQRDLIAGMPTLEIFLKKPVIFDLDDAIWLSKPFGKFAIRTICEQSALIFAGNKYIADYVSQYNHNVAIIPTGIDTEKFKPNYIKDTNQKEFVIGWTGSAQNLQYLTQIEKQLSLFLNRFPDSYLHILCDSNITPKYLPQSKIRFTNWSPSNEANVIKGWSVGIMPLPNNEFSLGKCSFKMLQYMAVEIPVVVSNIGMNRELLLKKELGIGIDNSTQWIDALEYLYTNKDIGEKMGVEGRKVVLDDYAISNIAPKIARHFKSLI
jgi:glycosyltransferase involved in cell wall biosynthesis